VSQDTSIPGGKPFPSLRELTGTVIDGRYQIGDLLGTGGMGAVYAAMQLRLDRRVAIKILNPVYMHREDYVTRFMREAKAASKIRHANVVQMMDFGELPGGSVYSVMEFLEGRDLAQLLQKEGRLPWPRTRDLMLQIARGLRAAHEQGVIHRDIKPANLFLVMRRDDDDGHKEVLKILDFGIARMQSQPSQNTSALTGTAELLGTPSYMAPELARGRSANPRSEVYSVGVVAYRMLTGRLPFEGETAFDVLFRSATEAAPPMRTHDPTIPAAVDDLVMRMIAREPTERFDQMAELYKAISAVDDNGRLEPLALNSTGPNATVPAAASWPGAGETGMPAPTAAPYQAAAVTAPVAAATSAPIPAGHAPTPYPPTPYPPTPYPPMSTGPVPTSSSGPQVVVPPPLSSDSMMAAAAVARAGNTAPINPHQRASEATGPARLDPLTPTSNSGLQRLPLPGSSEVTNPGLFEPTPGSMRLPIEPAGGATVTVTDLAGFDTPTGPGSSYDSLTAPSPKRDRKVWYIVGAAAFVLVTAVTAMLASGDPEPTAPATKPATVLAAPPVEPEVNPTPAPEPAPPAPAPVVREGDDDGAPEPTIIIEDPEPEKPPTPTPTPRPVTKPPARGEPKTPPTPRKPPSGGSEKSASQITQKLKQQAKKSCGSLLGGKPLTVRFAVGANGKTMMVKTDGGPVLDKCVKKVVEEGEYPTGDRTHQEKFKL
jgi:serine/threonine-protein kinase